MAPSEREWENTEDIDRQELNETRCIDGLSPRGERVSQPPLYIVRRIINVSSVNVVVRVHKPIKYLARFLDVSRGYIY